LWRQEKPLLQKVHRFSAVFSFSGAGIAYKQKNRRELAVSQAFGVFVEVVEAVGATRWVALLVVRV
jgi:hypothetical protein